MFAQVLTLKVSVTVTSCDSLSLALDTLTTEQPQSSPAAPAPLDVIVASSLNKKYRCCSTYLFKSNGCLYLPE